MDAVDVGRAELTALPTTAQAMQRSQVREDLLEVRQSYPGAGAIMVVVARTKNITPTIDAADEVLAGGQGREVGLEGARDVPPGTDANQLSPVPERVGAAGRTRGDEVHGEWQRNRVG